MSTRPDIANDKRLTALIEKQTAIEDDLARLNRARRINLLFGKGAAAAVLIELMINLFFDVGFPAVPWFIVFGSIVIIVLPLYDISLRRQIQEKERELYAAKAKVTRYILTVFS